MKNEILTQNFENAIGLFEEELSSETAFINANTIPVSNLEISNTHIIPVFVKDNEPLISHSDFINSTYDIASNFFKNEIILQPAIRASHPIKGRTPNAKDKPAKDLLEDEKTLYYERMMFLIEIPSIRESINGNEISLTIGGVKAYSNDNLYNRKGSDEHFKIFIGFKNKVCTNLCVASDGIILDLKVKSLFDLKQAIFKLLESFNSTYQINQMKRFTDMCLTEQEFANMIGRARLYNYLPIHEKKIIPNLEFGDNQIGAIAKDYYQDKNFGKNNSKLINLWNIYNLFTGANKSSYIDTFLGRSLNAFDFTKQLADSIENRSFNWFLN
jgi:hypothetical protein